MVIKRFSNMLGSRHGANPFSRGRRDEATPTPADDETAVLAAEDTPEGAAGRGVRLFCESGGPNNQGEEVLHLPVIVEAAESSPAAAAVAAQQIRHFLAKSNYGKPHVQYNAVMLIRILSENPGAAFTRNIDAKFTATVKQLLREGRDQSVQQILRETLQILYMEKAYDTNLAPLFQMWSKESGLNIAQSARTGAGQGRNSFVPARQPGGAVPGLPRLPPPVELAARLEEAKTSAKLLQQLVQSTPPADLQNNDLIKEFAERCQNAQKSMQLFMNASDPAPDDDTMQTLIETSEQLSLAASKHQRAVLQARRAGHNPSPATSPPLDTHQPPKTSHSPDNTGYTPVSANTAYPPAPGGGYAAPSGPPPGAGFSNPGQPAAATFVPTESSDADLYHPPPVPPPGMRDTLKDTQNRRGPAPPLPSLAQPPSLAHPTGASQPPSLAQPPSLKPAPLPPVQTAFTEDDPFSDANASIRDDSRAPVPSHPPPQHPTQTPQTRDYDHQRPEYESQRPEYVGYSSGYRRPVPAPAPGARDGSDAPEVSPAREGTAAVGVRAPSARVVEVARAEAGQHAGTGDVSPEEGLYGYRISRYTPGTDGGADGAGAAGNNTGRVDPVSPLGRYGSGEAGGASGLPLRGR